MVDKLSNLAVVKVGVAAVRQARTQDGLDRRMVISRFLRLADTSPGLFERLDVEQARMVLVRGSNILGRVGIGDINEQNKPRVSRILALTAKKVLE